MPIEVKLSDADMAGAWAIAARSWNPDTGAEGLGVALASAISAVWATKVVLAAEPALIAHEGGVVRLGVDDRGAWMWSYTEAPPK